jgi:competence ComEA-like helix-hairpin-helix protein
MKGVPMMKVRKLPWRAVLFFIAFCVPLYAAQGVINVNTATTEEFMMLPGIGEKTASAIVKYRQVNGSFKTIDDMTRIKGMSKKRLDRLRLSLVLTGRNTYIPAQSQKEAKKTAPKQ